LKKTAKIVEKAHHFEKKWEKDQKKI